MILQALLFIFAFSILNRARGSAIFNQCPSTVVTRIIAMGGMSFLTSLFFVPDIHQIFVVFLSMLAGLMLWATPAWDAYWGAEIGESPKTKIWGCYMMFFRQLLILPSFLGLTYLTGHQDHYWMAASGAVLWLPYFVFGAIDRATAIPFAEYLNGAIIGVTMYFIVN